VEREPQRIEQVDGLRAVACLLVIWQHVSESYRGIASSGFWISDVANHFDFGRIGVVAFFAISGFVIPGSLRGPRLETVVNFAFRRFWRLYPAFWFSLPLGVLSVWTLWGKQASLSMVIANLTMVPSLWGQDYAMGHYWTLEVELVFYAACALLHLVARHMGFFVAAPAFVGLMLLEFLGIRPAAPGHWHVIFLNLAVMALGWCCRLVYDQALPRPLSGRKWVGYLFVGAITAFALVGPAQALAYGYAHHDAIQLRFGWGYAIGVLLFVIWALALRVRSALLERIGKSTYSIYLLHPVAFYCLLRAMDYPLLAALKGLHLGLYVLALTPICVLTGMLAYAVVEHPAERLRKLLSPEALRRAGRD
jgi:peptidoglycan/LPS O-acetylase OafA/YrhL